MQKTTQQIDAEKARKSRPDLLPGLAIELTEMRNNAESRYGDVAMTLEAMRRRDAFGEEALVDAANSLTYVVGGKNTAASWLACGHVMTYGFAKHGDCTWRVHGTDQANPRTHFASAMRHVLEYAVDPEAVEEGSGLPVLHHALTQILITLDLIMDPPCPEAPCAG